MLTRLKELKEKFIDLEGQLADDKILRNQEKYIKLTKEHSALAPIVEAYDVFLKTKHNLAQVEEHIRVEKDDDMFELYKEELKELKLLAEEQEEELKIMLLPVDPLDEKNVVLEIRAGAGGDEAGLFANSLLRMYIKYCEKMRFKVEELDSNTTELGGVKEVSYSINGKNAYARLKYESGVHRVQRVPETESQGRVHTSTVTVAVLPEAEEVEVNIDDGDLKIDTYRSSGAGGQHVNKTESAIRITHLPTGIVVACQDERSQIKNRERAMKLLRAKIFDHINSKIQSEYSQNRKSLVGTGDRSERIRTYNFPQGRVTDHRIGLTLYNLETFMEGDIDEMIDALAIADKESQLKGE